MTKNGKVNDYLWELIAKMEPHERKCLRQYLRCFDPNFSDAHQVKTLQLFDLIENGNSQWTEEVILRKIYPDGDEKKFRFLKLRLIQKIYENLLLEVNTERKGSFSPQSRVAIEVRKKLILAQILWSRDLAKRLGPLLHRVITKAEENELYPEMLEGLYLKQQLEGMTQGLAAYMEVQAEIEACTLKTEALRRARNLYSIMVLGASAAQDPSVRQAFLQSAIGEVQTLQEQTGSLKINFYLHMLRLGFHQMKEDYASGSRVCADVIALLRNDPDLFHPRYLGIAHAQLADNELLGSHFEEALHFAREALTFISPSAPNHGAVTETEFYALLYAGKTREAEEVVKRLTGKYSGEEDAPVSQQRRIFLLANVLFLRGEYTESYNCLQIIPSLLKDKSGWNIGVRLLEIMILLERNQFDRVELVIDSLRKHLSKQATGSENLQRYLTILKVLGCLVRNSFNYQKALKTAAEQVALLASEKPDYRWKIKGYEIVPFHQWMQQKA
jgi:hypothetical protein